MTSSPHAIRISFRKEDFQFAVQRPLWPVALGAVLVGEAVCLATRQAPILDRVFILPAAVLSLCAATLWVMSRLYTLRIGPDGIGWHDFWRHRRQTPWSAIRRARVVNVLGLQYLLLRTDRGRTTVWIPLFVTHYPQLRDLLVTYTDRALAMQERLIDVE